MIYKEFIKNQINLNIGLKKIIEILPRLKDKKIVTFCHDDPDGVTSGILFKRLTNKLSISNTLFFPPSFPLSRKEILEAKKIQQCDVIFIIDKGTLQEYNTFTEIVENIFVIDHHPKIGENFEKITIYNPAMHSYVRTSASLLLHIISSYFDYTDEYDDFICLVGMKCDWAVDPLNNDIPEFCKPFYEEKIKEKFGWPINKRADLKPTMFEIKNQTESCLLNQIAELFFAITGGGYQYFYNLYDKKLENIDQPKLCFEIFLNEIEIKKFKTIQEFINLLPSLTKKL